MKKIFNQNIQPTYVDIDNAILLKNVGFDVPCTSSYTVCTLNSHFSQSGVTFNENRYMDKPSSNSKFDKTNTEYFKQYSAPTMGIVLKWLAVNYSINLCVICQEGEISYEKTFQSELNSLLSLLSQRSENANL
jgi:hypothetical protein